MSSLVSGQIEDPISKEQATVIFEKTKNFPENTELSFAFINDGHISYHGTKRIKDTLEYSNNSDKIFEIGSITKVFTSTILAELVLEHKIELNASIQDYINYPIKDDQITVLQLANHTSGLPRLPSNLDVDNVDESNPYRDYGIENLKQIPRRRTGFRHNAGNQLRIFKSRCWTTGILTGNANRSNVRGVAQEAYSIRI